MRLKLRNLIKKNERITQIILVYKKKFNSKVKQKDREMREVSRCEHIKTDEVKINCLFANYWKYSRKILNK